MTTRNEKQVFKAVNGIIGSRTRTERVLDGTALIKWAHENWDEVIPSRSDDTLQQSIKYAERAIARFQYVKKSYAAKSYVDEIAYAKDPYKYIIEDANLEDVLTAMNDAVKRIVYLNTVCKAQTGEKFLGIYVPRKKDLDALEGEELLKAVASWAWLIEDFEDISNVL